MGRHASHATCSKATGLKVILTSRYFCSQLSSPVGEVGAVVGAGLDAGPLSAVKQDSKRDWAADRF
jgi:hypothetical protein